MLFKRLKNEQNTPLKHRTIKQLYKKALFWKRFNNISMYPDWLGVGTSHGFE